MFKNSNLNFWQIHTSPFIECTSKPVVLQTSTSRGGLKFVVKLKVAGDKTFVSEIKISDQTIKGSRFSKDIKVLTQPCSGMVKNN